MKSEKVSVVQFYNTGICETEGNGIVKLSDRDGLVTCFLNEIRNLDEADCLEVRIKEITKAEWKAACKLGREMA